MDPVLPPPALISGYFGPDDYWARLARVLAASAARHLPRWDRRVGPVTPPAISVLGATLLTRHRSIVNTQKMQYWRDAVHASADGAALLLLDADTLITRPLDDVWELDFDVAYTTKAATRIPFNAGVVFVRVSPSVRAFMDAWLAQQVAFLQDRSAARPWQQLMIGVSQAALAALLDRMGVDPRVEDPARVTGTLDGAPITLRRLPCLEWNCEDAHWARYDPAITRIVHVKSGLRDAVLGRSGPVAPALRPLIAHWRAIEQAALAGAGA